MRDYISAFPVPASIENDYVPGMTLLDYFAAKAMGGLCVNPLADKDGEIMSIQELVATAYRIADVMLAEREKKS